MSSPTDTKKYEISDLPPEVFPMVFKLLTVNERKPVKLVCKSWLEFFNAPSLMNDEVLTCLNLYELSDIYELLHKSKRQFLNLKFENVNFHKEISFWKNNGLRVRSLDFTDCRFHDGSLAEIITCCERLLHLSFIYTEHFTFNITDHMKSLSPISDVEEVSANGIVRENLSSLAVHFINSNGIWLSDHLIQELFLLFPNIKILKIMSDFSSSEEICLDLTQLPEKNHVTMSPVLNYLNASTERIEKLELSFPSANFSADGLRCILETVSSLKRLTELCISTGNTASIKDIGTFLFSKQLKSLEFCIGMSSTDLTSFLSRLLHLNSNLQYLKIHRPNAEFIVSKSFCDEFISSGLKNFVVTVGGIDLDDSSFDTYFSTQNESLVLADLSLRFSMGFPENTIPLLQEYQSLIHFEVDCISYNVLQCLLKYQKKLRSLKIVGSGNFDYFNFLPGDLTFKDLPDIEYLELTYQPVVSFFLRTLPPDPSFTKLKYLRIQVAYSQNQVSRLLLSSTLVTIADAMPFLEGICVIDSCMISIAFDDVMRLCSNLSRLRYLYFMGSWHPKPRDHALTDAEYRQLFSVCPSLRVFIHSCSKISTYYFDTMKKEVVLKQDNNSNSNLGRPRIGDFIVSWLEF